MSFAPKPVVDGPIKQPFPFGFFSVAAPREPGAGSPHWQNGIQWESLGCPGLGSFGDVECDHSSHADFPKTFESSDHLNEATPFGVYGEYVCKAPGHTIEHAQEFAAQRLLTFEQAEVERIFWTGEKGNPSLLGSTIETVTTGEVSAMCAMGALENFISSHYGVNGVIHASRGAALALMAADLVEAKGSMLQTKIGTPVIAGAGYPRTGPDGDIPNNHSTWVFASPMPIVYRSEIFAPSAQATDLLDRGTNELYGIAERTYVIGFDDCGIGAAKIDFKK